MEVYLDSVRIYSDTFYNYSQLRGAISILRRMLSTLGVKYNEYSSFVLSVENMDVFDVLEKTFIIQD